MSLIGKINILKMNVLPKLLYLFQNIPLPPPSSLFTQLKKLFVRFLWNNRRPRTRLSLLYLPFDRGGLKCPNPLWYYWAAQLRAMMFHFTEGDAPLWKEMEELQLGLPLPTYLYSASTKILKKNTKNPIVKNMITVWYQVKKYLGETSSLSAFSPIWRNESFPPGKTDGGFKSWASRGLRKIGDLYNMQKVLMTFGEIVDKFNIPRNHFFKYLQLRNFIRTHQNQMLCFPEMSTTEKLMNDNCLRRGLISKMYKCLVDGSTESSAGRLGAWREDLEEDLSVEKWEEACTKAQLRTTNTRLRLLQYNWLMRTYITPEKLNRYNSAIPDTCIKCEKAKGTFFHCIWQCTEIQKFWQEVKQCFQNILQIQVPLIPQLFILGLYPDKLKIKKNQRVFVDLSILTAKRVLALSWKNTRRPTLSRWLSELSSTLPLEKITYTIKHQQHHFHQIWDPFIYYVSRTDLSCVMEEPGDM